MCLSKIAADNVKQPEKLRTGWKYFAHTDNRTLFPACIGNLPYRRNVWNKADQSNQVFLHAYSINYIAGFHIFPTKKAACEHWMGGKEMVLAKVAYKDVTCQGYETGKDGIRVKVHVAAQMKILPVPRKKSKKLPKKSLQGA